MRHLLSIDTILQSLQDAGKIGTRFRMPSFIDTEVMEHFTSVNGAVHGNVAVYVDDTVGLTIIWGKAKAYTTVQYPEVTLDGPLTALIPQMLRMLLAGDEALGNAACDAYASGESSRIGVLVGDGLAATTRPTA